MPIEFVTFFADGSKSLKVEETDLSGVEQINLLWLSIKTWHPDARITVLSDEKTDLGGVTKAATIRRYPLDIDRIMYERMRTQVEYTTNSTLSNPIVLIDTDTLVTGSLHELFAKPFDICFTWRSSDEMPINGGVIFLNNRDPENAKKGLKSVFDLYTRTFADASKWYGDQFAILKYLELTFSEIYQSPTVDREGVQVMLAPCSIYNFSPNGQKPKLYVKERNARIYHFKGMSRRLMKPFWDLHLSENRPNALNRWLIGYWTSLVLRVRRHAYRDALQRDIKRFNCGEQANAAWIDRAEIACEFIKHVQSCEPIRGLVDIGCGDMKLRRIMLLRDISTDYVGYDLHPQSDEVIKYDLGSDPSIPTDLSVVLGVLEYSRDLRADIAKLKAGSKWMIVSHAVSDRRRLSRSAQRRLNWINHLSIAEFEERLLTAGFTLVDKKWTANEKSVVWLCRAHGR